MKYFRRNQLILYVFITVCLITIYYIGENRMKFSSLNAASSPAFDIKKSVDLLMQSPTDMQRSAANAKENAERVLNEILSMEKARWSYQTIIAPLDQILSYSLVALCEHNAAALALLHPDAQTREVAQQVEVGIKQWAIDKIFSNGKLYTVIARYAQLIVPHEQLSQAQTYFIIFILEQLQRSGAALSKEEREQFVAFQKRIVETESAFDMVIAADATQLKFSASQLQGVPERLLQNLAIDENGYYIVGLDYPTYFTVIEECEVAETRHAINQAFSLRAYPENAEILSKLIQDRAALAKLLNFNTYASFDIAVNMAKEPLVARNFLYNLLTLAQPKIEQEVHLLVQEATRIGVSLYDNKIAASDSSFLQNRYKREHLNLDESVIAEYFPLEFTLKQLMKLYEQFFGLRFTKIEPPVQLYDPEVQMIRVDDATSGKILGYFLLDLFPRPNKYSHAAHLTLVPAVKCADGTEAVHLSVVIANFPRDTALRPALMKLKDDVQTFFHEFGHALHALLGKTEIGTLSGTNTKTDFVELPSQMLEEWLYDRAILKTISKHYKTGEALPDDLIDAILKSKNLFSGLFVQRQVYLSLLSLEYYDSTEEINLSEKMRELQEAICPEILFNPKTHFYASFGHLGSYGAKYYSYLYSKVFALDLFKVIKQQGIQNPAIGKKYAALVLAPGGSDDPNNLLRNFLGREVSMDAFIADLLSF